MMRRPLGLVPLVGGAGHHPLVVTRRLRKQFVGVPVGSHSSTVSWQTRACGLQEDTHDGAKTLAGGALRGDRPPRRRVGGPGEQPTGVPAGGGSGFHLRGDRCPGHLRRRTGDLPRRLARSDHFPVGTYPRAPLATGPVGPDTRSAATHDFAGAAGGVPDDPVQPGPEGAERGRAVRRRHAAHQRVGTRRGGFIRPCPPRAGPPYGWTATRDISVAAGGAASLARCPGSGR